MDEPRYFYRCFAHPDYAKTPDHYQLRPLWTVVVERFLVTKQTPSGVWITDPFTRTMKKFILLRNAHGQPTMKRWANPSIEEAMEAFRRRMGNAIEHAEYALHKYRNALDVAKQPGFIPECEWETKHVPTIF